MPRRISSPEFVGRHAELQRLLSAFQASAGGSFPVVLVSGEAGIGKTRLIRELIQSVERDGGQVVHGACVEMGDEGLPFAAVLEALESLRASMTNDAFLGLVGSGRAELMRLVPGSTDLPVVHDEELGLGAQARLFAQIAALLGRLAATRRTAVVLEDLHWADRSTRDLIAFLTRSRRHPGLMLVLTYRADALHRRHPLRQLLAELERLDNIENVELERFGVDDVAAQVAGIMGVVPPKELVTTLHGRADGNPFFIEELVAAHLSGSGARLPETVRDVVVARVARLDQPSQAVLRSMSVVGRQADHELLAAVTGIGETALLDAIRDAVDERVLVPIDASGRAAYAFRHALVQEALYDELLPAERSILHRAVAQHLEGQAPSGATGRQAEVAVHWERARDAERAIAASMNAADEASAMLAFGEAQGHLERILAFWSSVPAAQQIIGVDRATIAERAAAAAAAAGNLARAVAHGTEALRDAEDRGDDNRAFRIRHHLVRNLWDQGSWEEASKVLAAGLQRADRASPADRARLLADLAEQHWHAGQYAAMLASAEESMQLAQNANDPEVNARARARYGTAIASMGDVVGGLDEIERAIRVPELDEWSRSYYTVWLTHVLELGGYHLRAADTAMANLRRLVDHGGAEWLLPYESTNAMDPLIQAGRWEEAQQLIDRLDWAPLGNRASSWVHESIAELQVYRGDLAAAQRSLDQARSVATATAFVDRLWLARTEGLVLRAQGRLAEASDVLAQIIQEAPDPDRDVPLSQVLTVAIEVEADLAVSADARHDTVAREAARKRGFAFAGHLEALVQGREDRIGPIGRVILAQVAAERTRLAGRSDAKAWAAAAAAAAANHQLFDEARWRYREAEALLQTGGDRSQAAATLRQGWSNAVALGAEPLRTAIEELAARGRLALGDGQAGVQHESVPDAAPRLSPREREVLHLVAQGRTNREIAESLFISHKTASVHVTHILDKLGVASRVEAALMAARAGLIEQGVPPES